MLIYILFFAGFGALILGAKYLVDGASSIGIKVGMSQLLIGLTIVALGTSLPELIINVFASINGNTGLAIGNVLGSNIMNTLLIIGVAALIYPIKVSREAYKRDSVINLFAILIIFVLANDAFLGRDNNMISRLDGIILLALFIGFLYVIFSKSSRKKDDDGKHGLKIYSYPISFVMIIGGAVGLYFGGTWIVEGATVIASDFGVSESTIGLTLIAMATSLPELVTSIIAALKKNTDIAIGNALGSNIFNIFLVLGTSAVITPISYNSNLNFEIGILLVSSLFVILTIRIGKTTHTISKIEGAILTGLYLLFFTFTILK